MMKMNDKTRYYGAYAKCLKMIGSTYSKKAVCTKCSKEISFLWEKFCPSCGSKVEEKVIEKKERTSNQHEISELLNDIIRCLTFYNDISDYGNYDFWIDNGGLDDLGVYLNDSDDCIKELKDKNEYIARFSELYEREITYLKSVYETVEIKCGYLQCANK